MENMGAFLATLVFMVLLFAVCREIVTWYWKVNRIVQLLESIDRKLGEDEPKR